MVSFTIITTNDLEDCIEIDSQSIKLWDFNQWLNELKKENVIAFGIKKNNQIINVCVLNIVFKVAEINYFSVHPIYRRKGFGSKLINKIISYCKSQNIEKIILEVSSKNNLANNFYSKFGFKTIAVRKNYYKNGTDALIKEKKLLKK